MPSSRGFPRSRDQTYISRKSDNIMVYKVKWKYSGSFSLKKKNSHLDYVILKSIVF